MAVAGFVVLLTAPFAPLALVGFLLIGLGASNIVPVLFRKAGAQTVMPPALAISAMTTTGYVGILAGPAAIGFVAKAVGLHNAFWMLAALLGLLPLTARFIAGGSTGERLRRAQRLLLGRRCSRADNQDGSKAVTADRYQASDFIH